LSRDNEISVCATRPPAGAALPFPLSQIDSTFSFRFGDGSGGSFIETWSTIRNIEEPEKGAYKLWDTQMSLGTANLAHRSRPRGSIDGLRKAVHTRGNRASHLLCRNISIVLGSIFCLS
jgi:hypothetical protein